MHKLPLLDCSAQDPSHSLLAPYFPQTATDEETKQALVGIQECLARHKELQGLNSMEFREIPVATSFQQSSSHLYENIELDLSKGVEPLQNEHDDCQFKKLEMEEVGAYKASNHPNGIIEDLCMRLTDLKVKDLRNG